MRGIGRIVSTALALGSAPLLSVVLLTAVLLAAPPAARAGDWYHVRVIGEVRDGHALPAQGVPLAISFDDWANPDSGVIVTGSDGMTSASHGGFDDFELGGFYGGFSLALHDPQGVYELVRTEGEGWAGDHDAMWVHRTFFLADAGAIAGVVRDAGGSSASGVSVELYIMGDDGALRHVVSQASDALGRFRFAGLGSRTYAVRFLYPPPHGPRFWRGSDTPASAGRIALGQDEARLDIDGEPVLPPTSSLAGRVTTRSGSGCQGVVVRAWQLADDGSLIELPAPVVTDERGAYVVEGLARGTYTVSLHFGRRFGGVQWLGGARDWERARFVTLGRDDHVDGLDFAVPRGILRGPRRVAL